MDACLAEQATALVNLSAAKAAAAAAAAAVAPTCNMGQLTHDTSHKDGIVSEPDSGSNNAAFFSTMASLYLQTVLKLCFPCLPPPLKTKGPQGGDEEQQQHTALSTHK